MSDLTTTDTRTSNAAIDIFRNSSQTINDGTTEVAKHDYRYSNDKWMRSLTEKTNTIGITTDSQLGSNIFTNRRRIISCSTAKHSSSVPISSSDAYTIDGIGTEYGTKENNDKSNVTVYRNDDNNFLFTANICTNHWARKQKCSPSSTCVDSSSGNRNNIATTSTNKIQEPSLENDRLYWSTRQQCARPAVSVDDASPFVQNYESEPITVDSSSSSLSCLCEYSMANGSKTRRFFNASAPFDSLDDGVIDNNKNTNNTSSTTNTYDKRIISLPKVRNCDHKRCSSTFDDDECMICTCEQIGHLLPTKIALSRCQSSLMQSPPLPLIAPSSCSTNASASERALCDESSMPSHTDAENCTKLESVDEDDRPQLFMPLLSSPASVATMADKLVRKKSSTRRKKPLAPKPPSIKPTLSGIHSPHITSVIDNDAYDSGINNVRV